MHRAHVSGRIARTVVAAGTHCQSCAIATERDRRAKGIVIFQACDVDVVGTRQSSTQCGYFGTASKACAKCEQMDSAIVEIRRCAHGQPCAVGVQRYRLAKITADT